MVSYILFQHRLREDGRRLSSLVDQPPLVAEVPVVFSDDVVLVNTLPKAYVVSMMHNCLFEC